MKIPLDRVQLQSTCPLPLRIIYNENTASKDTYHLEQRANKKRYVLIDDFVHVAVLLLFLPSNSSCIFLRFLCEIFIWLEVVRSDESSTCSSWTRLLHTAIVEHGLDSLGIVGVPTNRSVVATVSAVKLLGGLRRHTMSGGPLRVPR